MVETPRPCPSWCTEHTDIGVSLCKSTHPPIPINRGHVGTATAYACQAGNSLPQVTVTVIMPSRQQDAQLRITDPAAALDLAHLLSKLALATPEQHRDLAEQVRHAAGLLLEGTGGCHV